MFTSRLDHLPFKWKPKIMSAVFAVFFNFVMNIYMLFGLSFK